MNHQRSAMALLVVLAAVVLVTSATLVAVTALAATTRTAAVSCDQRQLADMLTAGEVVASEWIRTRSSGIVLGPQGGGICIARDQVVSGGLVGDLQIDCYDCLAMPSADRIRPHGPLRVAMVLSAPRMDARPEGLVASTPWLEEVLIADGVRRFPRPLVAAPVIWGERTIMPQSPHAVLDSALAISVSPHGDGCINLNTAPLALLRDVYHELQLGDLGQVAQHRQAGMPSLVPDKPASVTLTRIPLFTLVTSSDRWAALITVATPRVRRSWWVVFAVVADKVRVVQRHDADR